MKYLIYTMILALGFSFAQAGDKDDFKGPIEKVFNELNLTPEQKVKLDEVRKAKREEGDSFRKQMDGAKEEMKKALEANASDADLKKQHMKIQTIRGKMDDARFNSLLAIRQLLTPEQRKKFHELKGKFDRPPHERRKGGKHGREDEE